MPDAIHSLSPVGGYKAHGLSPLVTTSGTPECAGKCPTRYGQVHLPSATYVLQRKLKLEATDASTGAGRVPRRCSPTACWVDASCLARQSR